MTTFTPQPLTNRQPASAVRPLKRTTVRVQRAPHNEQHTFVMLNLDVVRALPVGSLGMLAKLLAFADGWDIDEDRLERDYNVTPGVIRNTHKDLRERGHLSKSHVRGKGNRITGSVWTVKEAPQIHAAEIRTVENHSEELHTAVDHPEDGHDVEYLPDGGAAAVEGARASLYPLSQSLLASQELEGQEPQSLNAGARESESEISVVALIHPLLLDFVPQLGEPNGHASLLETEIARLGETEARAVLLGCDKAGSWQYILKALTQRRSPGQRPPPTSAPPPSEQPPLGGVWATVCSTIPDHAARRALTFDAAITEPDPHTIRVESAPFDGDLLAEAGVQAALEVMRDMDITVQIAQQPVVKRAGAA